MKVIRRALFRIGWDPGLISASAHAQDVQPEDTGAEDNEIVVTGVVSAAGKNKIDTSISVSSWIRRRSLPAIRRTSLKSFVNCRAFDRKVLRAAVTRISTCAAFLSRPAVRNSSRCRKMAFPSSCLAIICLRRQMASTSQIQRWPVSNRFAAAPPRRSPPTVQAGSSTSSAKPVKPRAARSFRDRR